MPLSRAILGGGTGLRIVPVSCFDVFRASKSARKKEGGEGVTGLRKRACFVLLLMRAS